jgi:hypothetical protein
VIQDQIAVMTERTSEVAAAREKDRRQVILPIEKAGFYKTLYRKIRLC